MPGARICAHPDVGNLWRRPEFLSQAGTKEATNIQDNDKAVATPGAPAGKRMPDIDEARGRQPATPKAPPAIASSRPRWSPPSSVPGRLIPPAVPVVPPVLTGNTELVGLAVNNQNRSDLDASFAAQHGLIASAAQGFRDTLPQVYWNAAIPAMIAEGYSRVFGTTRSDQLDHVVLERKDSELYQIHPNVRQTGMSVLPKQTGMPVLAAYANGFASPPNPVPFERLVISEFRLRGPAGVADEYIQLTNITGQSITVSTADGSSGWALVAISSSGSTSTKFVIPNATIIPAGAHYLAANSAYSLTAYATPDRSYTGDIGDNTGIALFRSAKSCELHSQRAN